MADKTITPYGSNGQAADGLGIVDNLSAGGHDKALSAEMGKVLLGVVHTLWDYLGESAFWNGKPDYDWSSIGLLTHSVSRSIEHGHSNKTYLEIADGTPLNETITFDEGYVLDTLTVTMGGVAVSASYISGNTISIPSVTGPVVIRATAAQGTAVALTLNGGLHCTDANGNTIPTPTAAVVGSPLSFEVFPDNWWQVPVLNAANDAKMTGGSLLIESITRQVTGSTWDANGVETQNQTVTAYGLRITAKNGSSNEVTGAITLKLTAKDVIQVGEIYGGDKNGKDGMPKTGFSDWCRNINFVPLINTNTVYWRWGDTSNDGNNRVAMSFYAESTYDGLTPNGWANDQQTEKSYNNDMGPKKYVRATYYISQISYGRIQQITSGTDRQTLFEPAIYYYAKLANANS